MSAMLALGAALLALVAGLFSSAGADRRRWQASAALAVALIAAGTWWLATPRGEIGHPVTAEATDSGGAPVSTVVVLQREGARRQVKRVPLRTPLDGAQGALWAALILGLLGGAAQLSGRQIVPDRVAAALVLIGAAAPVGVFMSAGSMTSGEAGVRAWLERFEVGPLQSFTVPGLPWSYQPDGALPLAVGALVAGLALVAALVATRIEAAQRLIAPAAALAALAVIWRMIEVGGLPWRPVEGALWAVAGLLALAAFDARNHLRSSTLVGAAVALAAVALGA